MKLLSTMTGVGPISAKSANGLIKRLRAFNADSAGFSIHNDNGSIVAYADLRDSGDDDGYAVYLDSAGSVGAGAALRIIPRKLVVQTVRLYADAQRLRHKLPGAPVMVVRPVAKGWADLVVPN